MNLVTAKCPDCGADLKIPEGSLSVTCEYCGSQVIVTDILGTGAVMQNCMTLAYAALDEKNYKDAYSHFNSALELSTTNYSAWFGKAICTGMTGKLIEFRIDEMLKLFETAFKYAPSDKLENAHRNAAAEIVKAIKAQMNTFKLQQEMLVSMKGFDDGDMIASVKEMEDSANKVKQEFIGALDKAREYDPSNADIDPLKKEIIEAAMAGQKPTVYTRPPIEHMPPPQHVNVQPQANVPQQVNENKKSGCSMMLAMAMFFIFACFGIVIFLLQK